MASTIRISILADTANAVRGLNRTGATADRTSAQLGGLKKRVDRLDGRNVNIGVKTRGFGAGVAQIIVANLALDRLRKGLPDLSFGLTAVADKFTAIAAAALAATAATLPLIGATVAAGAALGAAGAGVALFGAVAVPTFQAITTAVTEYNTASHNYDKAKALGDPKKMTKALQDERAALGALTPTQRAAAQQVIAMNNAWQTLSDSAAPTVLGVIERAAGTLAQIIPKLSPAIEAMGRALSGISDTALAGLARSVSPFVTLVDTQGVPALKTLATTAGNVAVMAGHLVTAFAPLGNVVLAKLAPLTAALRSVNFDSLARSAGRLLPGVGSLLGNLGGAVGNLVTAVAPLAGPVLQALSDIAGTLRTAFGGPDLKLFVTNIGRIVPAVAPIVAVLVPALLQFAGIISGDLIPLIPQLLPLVRQLAGTFVNVLTGLSPLLGPLLNLVGVLVSFVPILYPVILAFRDAMIPVLAAVSAALVQLRPSFAVIVAAVIKLLPPIAALLVSVVKLAPVLVSALVPAIVLAADVTGRLLGAFAPLFPVLSRVIAAVAAGVTPVLTALGDALPSVVDAVGQLAAPLLAIAVAVLPIIPPISQLAVALVNALVPAGLALVPVLVNIADAVGSAIPAGLAVLTPLLTGLTSLVGSPVFASLAGTVLAIVVGIKLWGITQAVTTGVVKAATVAQRLFQAAMSIGQLTRFIAGLGAAKVASIAMSAASKAAAAGQWLLNVALDANPIALVVIAVAALVAGIIYAYTHCETFRRIVTTALHAVTAAFEWLWNGARSVLAWIGGHWKTLLAIITGPVGLIVLYVTSHWDQIRSTIVNGFNAVVTFFTSIPGKFLAAGKAIMRGLVDGIDAGLAWVRDRVKGLGALIPDWLKSVLGIHSPSTVGVGIGANFTKSIGGGITSAIPHVKKALGKVHAVVTTGMSTVGLTASGPLKTAQPITGSAGAGAAAYYTIHNHVAPGADPAEAGRQTVSAIEAHERRTGRKYLATP